MFIDSLTFSVTGEIVGRREFRNEDGFKNTVQVYLDGIRIERPFRNKGEAISYLQKEEDLTREDIKKRVRFIFGNSVN